MVYCGLTTVKAAAVVRVGPYRVATPYVQTISISRTRGQLVSTASVRLNLDTEFSINTATPLVIYLYNEVAYTGYVKRVTVSPSLRCAGEITVQITAEDVMYKLENRNMTRRQKLAGLGPMAFITSLYKRTSVAFDDLPARFDISGSSSPIEVLTHSLNMREMTMFATGYADVSGPQHPVTKNADPLGNPSQPAGGGTGTDFFLHDHTTLDITGSHAGGPVKAVFSTR